MDWQDNPDTTDILKWAAIAGAAWFIYTKMVAPQTAAPGGGYTAPPGPPVPDAGGAQGGPSSPPPPPPGNQPGQTAPPPPPPGGAPIPGSAGSSGRPAPPAGSIDALRVAAAVDSTYAQGYNAGDLLNQHQWNYYREWGGQSIFSNDLSPAPHTHTMSAQEYHYRRGQVAAGNAAPPIGGGMAGVDDRYMVM